MTDWRSSVRSRLDWMAGFLSRCGERIALRPEEKRIRAWYKGPRHKVLRFEYDLSAESCVFDLGGYEGQWASDIFGRYACAVHVFEPLPQYAEEIKARFARNEKIRLYPFGLAAANGQETIGVSADSSSLFQSGGEQVECRFVEAVDFLEGGGFTQIDLMKINIEGGEYELLEHLLERDWVRRIVNIQVQFHVIVPDAEARMARIQQRLGETHSLTYQFPFVWENWRRREP